MTPQDTPDPRDVLRGHQWKQDPGGEWLCTCGHRLLPVGDDDRNMADHQLGVLQASGLAVVSVHGTAGVVEAAAAVVGVLRTTPLPIPYPRLGAALDKLVARVEALGR